jgi:hypothetical protein
VHSAKKLPLLRNAHPLITKMQNINSIGGAVDLPNNRPKKIVIFWQIVRVLA